MVELFSSEMQTKLSSDKKTGYAVTQPLEETLISMVNYILLFHFKHIEFYSLEL